MIEKKCLLLFCSFTMILGYHDQYIRLNTSNPDIDNFLKINIIGDSLYSGFFPGTLWCGKGNISNDGESLGVLRNVDFCCQAHDKCPDIITEGQTKYKLKNTDAFGITRLNCICDEYFRMCLKNVIKTVKIRRVQIAAEIIGIIYFSILKYDCFKYSAIEYCVEYSQTVFRKCERYQLYNEQLHLMWHEKDTWDYLDLLMHNIKSVIQGIRELFSAIKNWKK